MPPTEPHSDSGSLGGRALLVVGTGPATKKPLLQKLKALDLRIVLLNRENNWAARFADDLIEADTYDHAAAIAKVEEVLKGAKIEGALTFWEDDIPLCAALREKFGWKGYGLEAALNARNKLRTHQALDAAGLQGYSMPYAQVRSVKELEKESERIGFPCVLKPVWGSSSQFVVLLDSFEEAKNAFEYVQANIGPKFDPIYTYGTEILLERFLPGAEIDVDMLMQEGESKFHAFTDNFPTAAPFFVETGDAMPSRHEDHDLKRVLSMAKKVVGALNLDNGALHVEARITPEGPRLIEVNARVGGDYIPDWIQTVWDADIVEGAARVALGLPAALASRRDPKVHLVSKYIIPDSSGVIAGIMVPDDLSSREKVQDVTVLKEAGDAVLVPPEGFEEIGWLACSGDTYAEAELNLETAFRDIKVGIARYDSTSSIGKTRRKNRFNAAQVARRRILQSARMEKIRGYDLSLKKGLRVGILCNRYDETSAGDTGKAESAVHADLTSVGLNIHKALDSKGFKAVFFDMNETPLPFEKIAEANVDLVFNVCERVNNSSLLEPHAAAILDCLGIPYSGSNPLTLALCIDKIKVKKILEHHGLPTPRFDYAFHKDDPIRDDLRYPLIVKPANTDNSIGISNKSVVKSPRELKDQIAEVSEKLNRVALIEEFIEGDEVDVTILGNEERVKVLPLSRSIFDDLPEDVWHIYPFEAKWSHDSVYKKIKTERPAKYSQKLAQLISEICLDAYNIFDCHDYARIEVRVDKAGNPFILEINPNPSINRGDCVPACGELIGLNYEDFILEILREVVLRYRARPPYYHLQSALVSL
ncbi:MAG: ATP-grasp domain-containing protein [Elusimicrobia bacterium]|nr:ATP-grasp domain-containing protein [Elusimicrobiota bacterium]